MASTPLYHPLNEDRSNFRLLTLLPGTDDMHGTLDVHDYATAPAYEALSYCWGDPTPCTPIQLNDQRFSVAHNLGIALRYLRLADRPRVLWIDAICINQQDVNERGHQVLAMTTIYRRASRVVVWLGEGDAASDAVFDAVPKQVPSVEGFGPDVEAVWIDCVERHLDPEGANASNTDRQGQRKLDKIKELHFPAVTERPWWSRVWVVQEVLLNPRDPLALCGHKAASWYGLVRMLSFLQPGLSGLALSKLARLFWMQYLRTSLRPSRPQANHPPRPPLGALTPEDAPPDDRRVHLAIALLTMSGQKATNPRDRVYGLLGICDEAAQKAIQPNYGESILDVYCRASRHLLQSVWGIFSWFSFCRVRDFVDQGGISEDEAARWPSWVPNFNNQPGLEPDNPLFSERIMTYKMRPLRPNTFKEVPLRGGGGGGSINTEKGSSTRLAVHISASVFDTVDTAVKLKSVPDLLSQIVGELDDLAYAAAKKPLPVGHPYGCLIRDWDVLTMITCPGMLPAPIDRYEYDVELAQARLASDAFMEEKCVQRPESWRLRTLAEKRWYATEMGIWQQIMDDKLQRWRLGMVVGPGRYFITTKLGFCGISSAPTQSGDVVTLCPNETCPVIFRPQPQLTPETETSPYYTVVGAAYLGTLVYNDEFFKLHDQGHVEEREFDII